MMTVLMCLVCWKSILELDFVYQLQNLDTVIHNEQKLSMAAMFVNRSGPNEQSL
jgi:hypothetical protein